MATFDLTEGLKGAFNAAKQKAEVLSNSERSKLWITCLANIFRENDWNAPVRVFSRDFSDNREHFFLNELLFDITVAEVISIEPAKQKQKQLFAITGCQWIVESEFHRKNSRELLKDFNKLQIGTSKNKLFIMSAGCGLEQWAKDTFRELAHDSASNFYLAFVPHPNDWSSENASSISVDLLN